MSAEPDASRRAAPALGELLVQRGLLTEQQLATALQEQRRNGRRLGDVIVELGFVPAPTIGAALATQHGGFLKSEYGTAFGFETAGSSGPVPPPPVTEAERVGAPAPPGALVEEFGLRLASTGDAAEEEQAPEEEPAPAAAAEPAPPAPAAAREPEPPPPAPVPAEPEAPAAAPLAPPAAHEQEDERARQELLALATDLADAVAARDAAVVDAAEARAELAAARAERDALAIERDIAVAQADGLVGRVEELERELGIAPVRSSVSARHEEVVDDAA